MLLGPHRPGPGELDELRQGLVDSVAPRLRSLDATDTEALARAVELVRGLITR